MSSLKVEQNLGKDKIEKEITVVIPSKDEEENIAECIESVFVALEGIESFEIILVDSCSEDRTVEIAKKYPDLVMVGGIDKRVLAQGKDAIEDYLQKVIPFMVKRGGFIPTCDHGVPDNVSFDNYMYYRKRMIEMDG